MAVRVAIRNRTQDCGVQIAVTVEYRDVNMDWA